MKSFVTYYKRQLNESERKLFDLGEAHKTEKKRLEDSLAEIKEIALKKEDAHAKEVEKL